MDNRAHCAALDQRPDTLPQGCSYGPLLGGGTGPQRAAGQYQLLRHDVGEVDRDFAAAQEIDLRDAALLPQQLQVPCGVVASDHVEDHIDAGSVGATADLPVQPLVGVVGPDLPPDRLGEGGEGEEKASEDLATSYQLVVLGIPADPRKGRIDYVWGAPGGDVPKRKVEEKKDEGAGGQAAN